MRSLEESRKRWQITVKHSSNLDDRKKSVRSAPEENPCHIGLRSVCWKIFLLFQTTEITGWSRTLRDSRGAYSSLKDHLLRYVENPDELGSALDPLDDDRHSPWNTLRKDEEIRAEIFQDVERCMPDEPFFRKPDTQRIMLDVLFVFCKINQDVGYRQGMHELLAPILWVIEKDAIDYGNVSQSSSEEDATFKETIDPSYVEHDAFTLLSLIMRTAKSFYELGDPDRKQSPQSLDTSQQQQGVSPIVERSKRIHEVYLARVDPDLAKHLTDIEVLPQIFLIRWIRLLFGREFPFDDLLGLWDVILAEDPALDLVDMVCVSMLLRIRWQLIDESYSFALMLLLKYPAPSTPHGPQTFVDDAIYLRDHFSAAGGAAIIKKYSGRPPPISDSRPTTPLGQAFGPRSKLNMSPLPSPSRFLQQQGGVEALIRGAAKGVYQRGEKLGINQAVRDAAEEVKKNMQGLQTPRSASDSRRTSEIRWSLDEGRNVTSSKAIAAMNTRNSQLARMLEQAMSDLRTAEVSREAMDMACAKVDFVRVYLEDSTMPLPSEQPEATPGSPRISPVVVSISPPPPPPPDPEADSSEVSKLDSPQLLSQEIPTVDAPVDRILPSLEIPASEAASIPIAQETHIDRLRAPVPTRSTIANSSFSWMLEPTESSPSPLSPKSTGPFLKSGRKPPNREKAAFLFGDDGGESSMSSSRVPGLADIDEGFNLTTIRSPKDK